MKKIIGMTLVFWIFAQALIINPVFSAELKEEATVKKCMEAAVKSPRDVSAMKSIQNPIITSRSVNLVCEGESIQDVEYQAILDILFSAIDVKVEKYLQSFKGTKKPMDSLEDLNKKTSISGEKGSFSYEYNQVCNTKILEYAVAFNAKNNYFPIETFRNTQMTLKGADCVKLYNLKLSAYYDAGVVIINRETVNNYQYYKQEYMSKIKDKYNKFLFKLIVYLGQLKVLNGKIYEYTKSAANQ